MRNKRKPFFYKEEKKRGGAIGIVLIVIAVFFIWASAVPIVRQLIFPPLYPLLTYVKSWVIPVVPPISKDFLSQTIYEVPDLPPAEVIFAESLEELQSAQEAQAEGEAFGSHTDEDGSAAISALDSLPTTTPTAAIQWVFVKPTSDPSDAAASAGGDRDLPAAYLTLPTVERADLFNDGPTALSAVLRYLGHTTNQYAIQRSLRPRYAEPPVSLDELVAYAAGNHPELTAIRRVNGTVDQLAALLEAEIPVVVPILFEAPFPARRGDDRLTRRFAVLYGYDAAAGTVAVRDGSGADRTNVPIAEFMENWYAFGREYAALFPGEKTGAVAAALGEDWEPERNLERAIEKFRTDVANLPKNIYAQLNLMQAIAEKGDDREAAVVFRAAANLPLPQRLAEFVPSFYEILFSAGFAEELIAWADYGLKLNTEDVRALIWKGWGFLLKNDTETAKSLFEKAFKRAPGNEDVRYALKYVTDYR